ncbi:YARHG domain-containing protein [Paraclostridium bifermentans]|uniref:YARHG domain-containing protein n=1 Tax=Paraclostridium bifermentans TaxID=1490 RepID=UPI00038D78E8|nr:YARHG domain-containing protein [Paraclostridium bifermentans]EQK46567.1 YARHG domain protein [[Clostridium] bifermentans ATCC 19299] [Paraclostridium bifermentans ATCC 19299]TQO57549.1 YARHG domain-containing protein [Paraclostridium bifermentans]
MKVCKVCKKELPENATFCDGCGNKIIETSIKKQNKRHSMKVIVSIAIVVTVCIVAIIGVLISKDKILYNHYRIKGDKEESISKSIDYYVDALEIKYTDEIVRDISDRIKESENFEEEITKLEGVLNEKDLNNLYAKMYVKKAEKNFNDGNYETSFKYLKKAEIYNYDIAKFEYYEDLIGFINNNYSENDYPVYMGYGESYYIIPDSSSRYLTKEELYQYDKSSLGFIRNEIFARHGYVFKNEDYRNYFTSMPWYLPDSRFKGTLKELNPVEKHNVELIQSIE